VIEAELLIATDVEIRMKTLLSAIVGVTSLLPIGKESIAQSSFPIITVKAGLIRNLQENPRGVLNQYSFNPEIQLEGKFAHSANDSISFSGAIYLGYWDDGVFGASSICIDCFHYSYRSYIIGARLGLLLEIAPIIPIGFWFGFAHHFIKADYVGGFDFVGNIGRDFKESSNTVEAVVYIPLRLRDNISIIVEYQQFFSLGKNSNFPFSRMNRRAIKLGIAFSI